MILLTQTCGLEMLVCSVGGVRGGDVGDVRGRDVGDVRGRDVGDVRRRDVGETQDLSTDPRWIQFLKTLQEKDYFQVCLCVCVYNIMLMKCV